MNEINYSDRPDEEFARLRARIDQLVPEMRAVFREDVPLFVIGSVRELFLESGLFGSELTEQALRSLKVAALEAGARIGAELDDALANEEIWLAPVSEPIEGRSIADVSGVWESVQGVNPKVEALLREHGFEEPGGGFGVSYVAPARFVGGRYLKSLVEQYWKLVEEMQLVTSRVSEQKQVLARTELAKRWESA